MTHKPTGDYICKETRNKETYAIDWTPTTTKIYYDKRLNKPEKTNDNLNNTSIVGTDNPTDNDNYTNMDNNNKYSDRQMWKTVKDKINNNRQTPPRLLLIDNKLTRSLTKICNHAIK